MTEMSPVGTVGTTCRRSIEKICPLDERIPYQLYAGRTHSLFVDMRIVVGRRVRNPAP